LLAIPSGLGKKISPEWIYAFKKVQNGRYLFTGMSFDLTSGRESAQKGLRVGAA
jgi:hypothetical protein